MSIFFITERGPGIGVGHYVRTKLIQKNINIKSYLILNNQFSINNKNIKLETLSQSQIKIFFIKKTVKIIYFDVNKFNNFHKKLLNSASTLNIKTIFYDLYHPIVKKSELAFFTPSFLVNKKKYYPLNFYYGWKYLIINKDKYNKKYKKKFDLLLSFGGSDPYKLTEIFLNFILHSKYDLKICCIIGPLNKRKKIIKDICLKSKEKIKFFEPKKNLEKFIKQSNLVITSVGLTSYEAIFSKVSTFFIPIKQIDVTLAKYFEKLRLGISGPYYKLLNNKIINKRFEKLLERKNIIINKKTIDGKGIERVINILMKTHENT